MEAESKKANRCAKFILSMLADSGTLDAEDGLWYPIESLEEKRYEHEAKLIDEARQPNECDGLTEEELDAKFAAMTEDQLEDYQNKLLEGPHAELPIDIEEFDSVLFQLRDWGFITLANEHESPTNATTWDVTITDKGRKAVSDWDNVLAIQAA